MLRWKGWAHSPSGGDFLWGLPSTSPFIFLPSKIPLPLAKLGQQGAELVSMELPDGGRTYLSAGY